MSVRTIVGIVAFCIAMTGVVAGNLFITAMIGEINRKRSGRDLVSYFGFTPLKVQQILDEYRASYPSGRLHLLVAGAIALTVIGLVVAAVCAGFFG